jgi:acetate kinase
MRAENLTPRAMDDFLNERCGLLGISQTSSDMRDLLKRRRTDSRAAEAVDLFCYQALKWIGAFAAALGGLDTLVFSGGIGEHAVEVRRQICEGLRFLGVSLDEDRNSRGADVISGETSAVAVRVMATDEEIMIARAVQTVLEEP